MRNAIRNAQRFLLDLRPREGVFLLAEVSPLFQEWTRRTHRRFHSADKFLLSFKSSFSLRAQRERSKEKVRLAGAAQRSWFEG